LELNQKNRMEVLSEKAFPHGHVDILIKDAMPIGFSKKIIVEVKLGSATKKDFEQLKSYMKEIGRDVSPACL